jgi:hypothetical protein
MRLRDTGRPLIRNVPIRASNLLNYAVKYFWEIWETCPMIEVMHAGDGSPASLNLPDEIEET